MGKTNNKPAKQTIVWTCDYCGSEFNTKSNSDKHELICDKNKKTIDKKDKKQVIGLIVILFILLILNANGFDAGGIAGILGSFVGAIFISSILSWIYFKIVKAERTANQKTKVMLIIAVIDALIVLIR